MTKTTAFAAAEEILIVGFERDCVCSHCGRGLKVGVKLAGFGGVFGSDCLSKSAEKQKVGPYIQKLAADSIKERALVAAKGEAEISRRYGWRAADANFRLVLKTPLFSI